MISFKSMLKLDHSLKISFIIVIEMIIINIVHLILKYIVGIDYDSAIIWFADAVLLTTQVLNDITYAGLEERVEELSKLGVVEVITKTGEDE